jgi:hypothetical protein
MPHGRVRIRTALALAALIGLAAGPAAAQVKVASFAAGFGVESFSRPLVWGDDAAPAGIRAGLVTARAEFGFARGIAVSLSAGLSPTDVEALTFGALPISLRYEGAPLRGLALGAEAAVPLGRFSSFEIGGAGRIVYSMGMKKTWPLEGFAVEGEAEGTMRWVEAAIGPRVAYRSLDKIVPYLEITLRWLHANFEMTETLGDLGGREARSADGVAVGLAVGADADIAGRFAVRAKAGLVPGSRGTGWLASIGVLYKFSREERP